MQVVFPPLDIAYLAAMLEEAGHECRIEDYPASGGTWAAYHSAIESWRPDLVILAVTEPTLANDLAAVEVAREAWPECRVAARGEVFLTRDREVLEGHPQLDYVGRGECDESLVAAAGGGPLSDLAGLTWRDGERIVRNPEATLIADLEALPLPARHLLNNSLYRSPATRQPMTTIQTARGCPAECIFCPVPVLYGKKVRYRSPESILREIEACVERYGIREFLFHADTFTLNRRWTIDICKLLVERQLPIRWYCNSRVDTIDAERLRWMKQAGCQVIGFGIECGNDAGLAAMKKGANVEQARRAVALCREYGIKSHAFFSFGFPWDTEETLEQTLAFAHELDPDFFDFNIAFPLPGTELHSRVATESLLHAPDGGRNGGYAVAALRTRTLSPEKLEAFRRRALWSMYLRPHYVMRTLAGAGSVGVAVNLARAAAVRARRLLLK